MNRTGSPGLHAGADSLYHTCADVRKETIVVESARLRLQGFGQNVQLGTVIPAGLFILTLLLYGGAIAAYRFDGLYGQDPFAYYDYALGPLRASLLRGEPPPPFFWPLGYPLLGALASLVAGARGPQFVSLLSAALVPVLTYALGRELFEERGADPARARRTAVLAGLVTALCGLLLQAGTVVMSDATALLWATLSAWALARYARTGSLRWLALAAFALAWSILTRWVYVLLLLPFGLYGAVAQVPIPVTRRQQWRRLAGHAAVALLVGLAVLAPELVLAARPAAPQDGVAHFGNLIQLSTWSPANALRHAFRTYEGYQRYTLPNALFYASAIARPPYFTPLLGPLVLVGLWAVVRGLTRGPRGRWGYAVLLVGWPAMMYLFLVGNPWQNIRYTLAMLPPLSILIALGVDALLAVARGWARALLSAWVVMGLVAMLGGAIRNVAIFIPQMQYNVETARWVEDQLPAEAQVLTFGLTLTLSHYTGLEVKELYYLTPEELPAILAADRPTFLFVDPANLEDQWAGRAPQLNYRWLRDNPGLTPVGQQGSFILYRVNDAS